MKLRVGLVLFSLALVSCSSPVCSAANCVSGCCDSAGQCQSGELVSQCGTQAAQCQQCEAGAQCVNRACVMPPVDAGHDAGPSSDAGSDAGFDAGFDAGLLDAGSDAGPFTGRDGGRPPTVSDAGCRLFEVPTQRLSGGYRVEANYEWSFITAGALSVTQFLDEVNIDLVWSAGGTAPVSRADLSLEPNYTDCKYCVTFRDRCRPDGSDCLGIYFARRGELTVTRAPRGQIVTLADGGTQVTTPPINAPMTVQLQGMQLQRWNIGDDAPEPTTDCVEFYDTEYTALFR